MRFSCQLLPDHPLVELLDLIAVADELGLDGCYSADETYHKDMWVLFAAAAGRTRRIRFGPEVSSVILRNPAMIAQQVATLDELTAGRAEVVYSIGNLVLLDQYGIEWQGTRPLARLREAHHVMRTFLDHGSIDFAGDYYRYQGLFTAARPVQERVPLKIGAMRGPGSFRLAGEIADGVHVACAHSSEALGYAAVNVREGATRAARALGDEFDFCASILGAISEDGTAAREGAGAAAAFYLSSMPPELVERHGVPYSAVQPAVDAFARGDVARALALAPADAGERFALAGTPEEWVDRIRRDVLPHGYNHIALGLADPFLVRLWTGRSIDGLPSLADQLRLIHEHVLPAFS